ncbi:hypothetical protein JOE59_002069 [Agromyces cerinus]|uniref:hypothetical protein n=1 Tax=Agromyces cerinus TaxID=33878 RepID=UPI001958E2F5|nr:hypothetical protein [Agromyces cerinus]MBM7831364.1 hypothetical protein [Agromyces cerinus]
MKKLSVAFAGLAIAALALTGCTSSPADRAVKVTPSAEAEPSEAPEAAPADAAFDGGADAAPGSTVPAGTWGNIPYLDYDDNESVLSHHLKSVDKAAQADVDTLVAEIPELKGMDVYFANVESRYVSGDLQPFTQPSDFDVVDANGDRVQSLILVGFDACPSDSFGDEDEVKTQVITNCYAAAVAPGGNVPAGVKWSQYETPTEEEPVLFVVK